MVVDGRKCEGDAKDEKLGSWREEAPAAAALLLRATLRVAAIRCVEQRTRWWRRKKYDEWEDACDGNDTCDEQ